jgi:hypothetical protein
VKKMKKSILIVMLCMSSLYSSDDAECGWDRGDQGQNGCGWDPHRDALNWVPGHGGGDKNHDAWGREGPSAGDCGKGRISQFLEEAKGLNGPAEHL